MNKPTVTILHSLPGRLRLQFSETPQDTQRFTESVMGHDGLHKVQFTDITRSLLVHYDTKHVTREEVLIRVAMALSLDCDHTPVVVWEKPENRVMANSAAYAGFMGIAALSARWLRGSEKARTLEKLAALATGASVVEHGWREVREQGGFDPEVLTLMYLVTAAARGDFLRGALVTWAMTFGRHLLGGESSGVEVRPVKGQEDESGQARYELLLHRGISRQAPLFSLLQSAAEYMGAAGGASQEGLLEQLRRVSVAHGEIVEGLSWMRQGIPMHFE